MEYFIPKTQTVTLPGGRPVRLRRGINTVPDELANHETANDLGIKPVEEMTDAEWRMLGLKKPAPAVVVVPEEPAEPDA